jgi:hypothetical protein
MTDWYAPNEQAVGIDIATAGAEPKADGYDPGAETVADVQAYVEANPDQREAVLAAEKAGKNRSTLVTWLEGG